MKETALRNKIADVKSQLEVEKLVSERIRGFIQKKKDKLDDNSEQRDKLREKNVQKLEVEKSDIKDSKEEAEQQIEKMNGLWEEEQDAKKQRELKDNEAAEKELQKQQ